MFIITRKAVVIFILIFAFTFTSSALTSPEVSASSAVLIDADTLEILYERNAYERRSMASTTKIMTGIIAVESGRLNDLVKVKKKPYIEGTAIGFDKGDTLTVNDLCYAMLLESGNDAAVLIAEFLAGSEEKFSVLMNKKAAQLGMENTNFITASGLDADVHYTTAYDMALLGAYAVKNSAFREICSAKSYTAKFVEPEKTRHFSNHNRLLSSCEGAFGIKTGFTKKSGRCLVSACERMGKTLVAVTLNAPDDWNDHKRLYDYGYSLYEEGEVKVTFPREISVRGSDKRTVRLGGADEIKTVYLKNSTVTSRVYLNKITYAPLDAYDITGKIVIYQNGVPIHEQSVYSLEKADIVKNYRTTKRTLFQQLADYIKDIFF